MKAINNNMMAVLVLLLVAANILFSFQANDYIDKLTGYGNTARVRFCVGTTSNIQLDYPPQKAVLSGLEVLLATITNDLSNKSVTYANFSYRRFGESIYTLIGQDFYNNDSLYNITWNTTTVPEGNCNYVVRVTSRNDCGPNSNENSFITVNNVDVEPIWSEFYNNITTNFTALRNDSQLGDWTSVSNPTLGIPGYGKIKYLASLNLDAVNFNNTISIGYNSINFSSGSECITENFWSAAELTFFNIRFRVPDVRVFGGNCSFYSILCYLKQYNFSTGTFSFLTSNPGKYSLVETDISILDIWDQTDFKGGNLIKFQKDNVTFFANYSGNISGLAINGSNVSCAIQFLIGGFWTSSQNMSFNVSSQLYQYTRSFNLPGIYFWNVTCNGSSMYYASRTAYDTVNITRAGINITINMTTPTQDNSPSFNVTTSDKLGNNINANCSYKTDFNPTNFTLMNNTGGYLHSDTLPYHNTTYKTTGWGHYNHIQHIDWIYRNHTLYVSCTDGSLESNATFEFELMPPYRDKVYYKDGDEIRIVWNLEETGLNITVNYSQIDSNFDISSVEVFETGLNDPISYDTNSMLLGFAFNEGQGSYSLGKSIYVQNLILGNSNLGDIHEPIWTIDSKYKGSSALEFDGVDDYTYVKDSHNNSLFNFTTQPFSLEAWIYKKDSGDYNILAKQGSYILGINSSTNAPYIAISTISTPYYAYNTAAQLSNNKWYHLAGVWNSSYLKIYVNGEIKNLSSASVNINPTNSNVTIGGTITNKFFNGTIDSVIIYNRSLTDQEVLNHYKSGLKRYIVKYDISNNNTNADGQYNLSLIARENSSFVTGNWSIFAHLHNIWTLSDIDNAFDCWNYKHAYYFDEIACDWESDLNHAADQKDKFTIEKECFDGLDNDVDGKIDVFDTDCPGIYYHWRINVSIDSAVPLDPCTNNLCWTCIGGIDLNDDGFCDTSAGVQATYLHKVRPGYYLRVLYEKSNIVDESVRLSINELNETFNASSSNAIIRQLPRKELGGCTPPITGYTCKSVTATTFISAANDRFTGNINEKIELRISQSAIENTYPNTLLGKSISGASGFQYMQFFEINNSAIVNESDNASYCFDSLDNELDDYIDCLDLDCNGTINPSNPSQSCEIPEKTCDDSYDNDVDSYTDCFDNSCFKNGVECPVTETVCYDGINNDFDYGVLGNPNISRSLQDGGGTALIDCSDIDCNGSISIFNTSIVCNYGSEFSCADGFDNDGDGYTDCEDEDCFKNGVDCPAVENYTTGTCSDSFNNDYDYGVFCNSSISVSYQNRGSYISLIDCIDIDCDGNIGGPIGQSCEYCNEFTCNDLFDNDADGRKDCDVTGTSFELDCDRWHTNNGACPTIENICYDSNDNDLDYTHPNSPTFGGVDCEDIDCNNKIGDITLNANCEYGNETTCDDNFDNDADGSIDCNDASSCQSSGDVCRPCPAYENITLDSCADGDDTDYDGATDCSDSDCDGRIGPTGAYCGAPPPPGPQAENCTDFIDNDGDGNIDEDDSECPSQDELGPGQCQDGQDNDNDGFSDCSDSDCSSIPSCQSLSRDCFSDGLVGAINVCHTRDIRQGENFTVSYTQSSTSHNSVRLVAGNFDYNLTKITGPLNNSNTYMIGTTTNFVKIPDIYGLKAQNVDGFSGNLDLNLTATTSNNTATGSYTIFVSTSVPGTYGETTVNVNVFNAIEREKPYIVSTYFINGSRLDLLTNGSEINLNTTSLTLKVIASDNGTYNSGIDHCEFNFTGSWESRDNCKYTLANLSNGTYSIKIRPVDGSSNIGNTITLTFNISITPPLETPYQVGNFYNFTNYPTRDYIYNGKSGDFCNTSLSCGHFNLNCSNNMCVEISQNIEDWYLGESLGIGVNFNSSVGFTDNGTGCVVSIRNSTGSLIKNDTVNLTTSSTLGICTGEVELDSLKDDYYEFTVEIRDNNGVSAVSTQENIWLCQYNYSSTLGYYCLDVCEIQRLINSPPILVQNFPSPIIMFEDTTKGGYDLDDYFSDPDGDILSYTYRNMSNIRVEIDSRNRVTFIPDANWFGTQFTFFTATDPFDAFAVSNTVTIIVINVPEPVISPPERPRRRDVPPICEPRWNCTEWSECRPDGTRIRDCVDLKFCIFPRFVPPVFENCTYIPTCFDRVQNQNETGIDCGGPCPECPTCNDGRINQGEEDIDCGGPCPPCPTCNDGIRNHGEIRTDCGGPCPPCPTCNDRKRNQGEEDIDCGGPCPPCIKKIIERPAIIGTSSLIMEIIILIMIIIVLVILTHRYITPRIFRIIITILVKTGIIRKELVTILEKELGLRIIGELEKLEIELEEKSTKTVSKEFYKIIDKFYKELLRISYEFTLEELKKELAKSELNILIKKMLLVYYKNIQEIKYAGYEISKEDLISFIDEAKKMVVTMTSITPGELGFEETKRMIKEIKLLIKKERYQEAKNMYKKVYKGYLKLENKEKKKIYTQIKKIYHKLKEVENG